MLVVKSESKKLILISGRRVRDYQAAEWYLGGGFAKRLRPFTRRLLMPSSAEV